MTDVNRNTFTTVASCGTTVFASVSPCSWMNPRYGLQVKLALTVSACNAESEFVHDPAINWENATQEDVERMCAKFLREGGVAKLRAAMDKWAKLSAEFDREHRASQKREAARDARAKARGHTHATDAWVHPLAGGDDFAIVIYTKGKPTSNEIVDVLRRQGSSVFTDYSTRSL